ncbi:GNAT family N-acetyltransferase [Agromyces badenianii]|uniref:GNAT family N-acetyltransferase n=1 Tax=Agromyces badenianii TaxID=2080742 RepID=A0A2S0WV53_9MICO|nr:GNAT family N-acetyltransferase [Agromyces badenianii]AWB95180.1 GNAT family N-acetyltransferase [Agromyces badenianii]PWC03259.1 N-acetyltransferase [Agromyces badenianii]
MGEPHVVTLRATRAGDLDVLFRFRQDPEARQMAGFASEDPADLAAFVERWERLIADPEVALRTVRADGQIVGDVVVWHADDGWCLGSWIDRAHWGRGIATRAVRLVLDELTVRPLQARVAVDNAGSIAVLDKLGFRRVGLDLAFANARGIEMEEFIYSLG